MESLLYDRGVFRRKAADTLEIMDERSIIVAIVSVAVGRTTNVYFASERKLTLQELEDSSNAAI